MKKEYFESKVGIHCFRLWFLSGRTLFPVLVCSPLSTTLLFRVIKLSSCGHVSGRSAEWIPMSNRSSTVSELRHHSASRTPSKGAARMPRNCITSVKVSEGDAILSVIADAILFQVTRKSSMMTSFPCIPLSTNTTCTPLGTRKSSSADSRMSASTSEQSNVSSSVHHRTAFLYSRLPLTRNSSSLCARTARKQSPTLYAHMKEKTATLRERGVRQSCTTRWITGTK